MLKGHIDRLKQPLYSCASTGNASEVLQKRTDETSGIQQKNCRQFLVRFLSLQRLIERNRNWAKLSKQDRELSRMRPALSSKGKTFTQELLAVCKRSNKRLKQTDRKIVLEVSADFQGSHPINSEASLSFSKIFRIA